MLKFKQPWLALTPAERRRRYNPAAGDYFVVGYRRGDGGGVGLAAAYTAGAAEALRATFAAQLEGYERVRVERDRSVASAVR